MKISKLKSFQRKIFVFSFHYIIVIESLILFFNGLINLSFGLPTSLSWPTPSSIQFDPTTSYYNGIVVTLENIVESEEFLNKVQTLINNASKSWYDATGTYFHQVTIVLPPTWNMIKEPVAPFTRYADADIRIISDIDKMSNSLTLQYAGCGKPGLPIQLSESFIEDSSESNGAKILMHQWALYRYGVFNEFGFPGDNLYPAYYIIPGKPLSNSKSDSNTGIRITSCTDGQNNFNTDNKDRSGNDCKLKINQQTGLPDNNLCIPLINTNNSIRSSIMYQPLVPTVNKFCGSKIDSNPNSSNHVHNSEAPNKQNFLCNGKDTWSVIKNNKDFKNLTVSKFSDVQFKYFKQSKNDFPYVLIAIEAETTSSSRIEFILDAITHTSRNVNNQLNISIFQFNEKKDLMVSRRWLKNELPIDEINFNKLDRNSNEPINLDFILDKANSEFKTNNTKGGTLVLLIDGSFTADKYIDYANKLKSNNVKLKIMIFKHNANYASKNINFTRFKCASILEQVLKITGGSINYIDSRNDNINDVKNIIAFEQLIDAFEDVSKGISGGLFYYNQYVKKEISTKNTKLEFKFSTDKSISVFSLITFQPFQTNDDLKISLEEKIKYDKFGFKLYRTLRSNYIYVTKSDDSENWTLKSEKIYPRPILSYVSFKVTDSSITAKCWLSHEYGLIEMNYHNNFTIICIIIV